MSKSANLITKIILKGQTDPSLQASFKKASQLADEPLKKMGQYGQTLKKVAKTGAVAVGATAAAVAGIGKASIGAFAEYEQLVGGVETLFKNNSGKLIQYANGAYKTAGLSANDYMSTITSFSAAMINSLGGNTAKATEFSNQAVIDMSDNANKMGTDMESIMNTYQSISRGQYGMLDNLKLGYGGTKTEMERLLKDAQKLTGIKYDISSFADVTQAIHAIQEKMGITGTTAKEASTTIQGSWNALKSSWTNLLTGLADPNQDLGVLIENVFGSATTFFEGNLMPRIKEIMPRIATAIKQFSPMIANVISELVPPLIPVVIEGACSIMKAVASSLPKIFSELISALPAQVTIIAGAIGGALAGIKIAGFALTIIKIAKSIVFLSKTVGLMKLIGIGISAMGGPITLIIGIIGLLVGAFIALWMKSEKFRNFWIGLWNKIKTAALTVGNWLKNFFTVTIPTAIASAINWFKALPARVSTFLSELPYKIGYLLGMALGKVVKWGIDVVQTAKTAIPKFIRTVVNFVRTLPGKVWTWLVNTAQKVASWGPQLAAKGRAAAVKLLNAIVNKVKEIPGKMLSIGKNIVKGLWNGIGNAKDWLIGKVKSFGSGIVDGIKGALGINSPSTVMRDLVGKFIPSGVAVGIQKNAKTAINAVKGFGGKLANTASSISPTITTKVANLKSKLPKHGTGGTFTRPHTAIVGDKPETIVPHGNTPRNRSLLQEAARGVGGSAGKSVVYNFTFAPVLNGGNVEENRKMLQEEEAEFERKMDAYFAKKGRLAF